MTPELVAAIKARIVAKQDVSQIKQSVLEGGYTEEVWQLAYEEANRQIATGETTPTIPLVPQTLPSVYTLVEDSFAFVFARLQLVWLLLIPSLLAYFITILPTLVTLPETTTLAVQVVAIPFYIVYACNISAVLYMVLKEDAASYREALSWVIHHIWALIFMYLLVGLAIFGGFLLFLIPGLIVLITLYFAPYSFVLDGKRGMDALLYSRQLVQGMFWPVLYKIVGFGLIMFIPVLLVGFLYGMAEGFGAVTLPHVEIVGNTLLEIFSAFYTVMGFQAMARIYTALKTRQIDTTPSSLTKALYGFLMFIGLVTIPLLIFLVYKYGWDESTFDAMPLETAIEKMVLRGELTNLAPVAASYQKTNNSYENVCSVLTPLVSVTDGVECNDSESAWAFAAVEGDERWCADTTTEAKLIQTPLAGNTACIALPKQIPAPKETEPTAATTSETGLE